jgi:hypothetical protein
MERPYFRPEAGRGFLQSVSQSRILVERIIDWSACNLEYATRVPFQSSVEIIRVIKGGTFGV